MDPPSLMLPEMWQFPAPSRIASVTGESTVIEQSDGGRGKKKRKDATAAAAVEDEDEDEKLASTSSGNELSVMYRIYKKYQDFTQALRVALVMDESEISDYFNFEIYRSAEDLSLKKQLSFIVARHGLHFLVDHSMARHDNEREELQGIINNHKLYQGYLTIANDIGVDEYVSPEDIYQGMLFLWQVDSWLEKIDDYMNVTDKYLCAGSHLSLGISWCGCAVLL